MVQFGDYALELWRLAETAPRLVTRLATLHKHSQLHAMSQTLFLPLDNLYLRK